MYQKKGFSMDVAMEKQEHSKTVAEATRNFNYSCEHCNKSAICIEERCRLYRRYKQQCDYIVAMSIKQPEHENWVATRKYEISSFGREKKIALKAINSLIREVGFDEFLTKCYKLLSELNLGMLKELLREKGYYAKGRIANDDKYKNVVESIKKTLKEVF